MKKSNRIVIMRLIFCLAISIIMAVFCTEVVAQDGIVSSENIELKIDSIVMSKGSRRIDGKEPTDYLFETQVRGSNITSVALEGQGGMLAELKYEPDPSLPHGGSWSWHEDYENESEVDANWPDGEYTFFFNDGEDSVTVDYTPQPIPGEFPTITYPIHGQTDVKIDPDIEWEPIGHAGDRLGVAVWNFPSGKEFNYASSPFNLSLNDTSWQPGSLEDGEAYSFLAGIIKTDPASGTVTSGSGRSLEYQGEAVADNKVRFIVGSDVQAPDILNIKFLKLKLQMDGESIPPHYSEPYIMVVAAECSGAVAAVVEGPNNIERTLEWHDDEESWQWGGGYDSETELDEDWPGGAYTFIFNDGAESVTVDHTPQAIPEKFLDITNPAHEETGVDLNPTYAWETVVGAGDALWLSVFEDPDDLDEKIYHEFTGDISMTSWQPGPLAGSTEYSFETAVVNLDPADGDVTSATGQTVEYNGMAWNFNFVEFYTTSSITYMLTYAAGPGGALEGESFQTVDYGESGSTVDAIADTGAEFRGWCDGVTDNPRTDHDVIADIDVTALFQSAGGVPIDWYDQYGLAPGDGETWSDLDSRDEHDKGMTLREEYVANTVPTEPSSVFRVSGIEVGPPVTITAEPSSTERVYTLQRSVDLLVWTNVTDQISVPGGTGPLTDPDPPESNLFHRVIVELP